MRHEAEGHPLDRAGLARRFDHVADDELVLDQDEESRDDVLDQALGTERDREPEDPGAGQDRADVDEQVEGGQDAEGVGGHPPQRLNQLGRGLAALLLGGQLGVIAVVHRLDDPPGDQPDNPVPDPDQEPDEREADGEVDERPAGKVEYFSDVPDDTGTVGGLRRGGLQEEQNVHARKVRGGWEWGMGNGEWETGWP